MTKIKNKRLLTSIIVFIACMCAILVLESCNTTSAYRSADDIEIPEVETENN